MSDAPLRPFQFGEILDGAFTLYRRNFLTFFGAGLILQIPLIIFWVGIASMPASGNGVDVLLGLASVLTMPYSLFTTILIWSALTWGVWQAYGGEEVELANSLKVGLRRWIPVAVASVISWMLIVFGFILFIIPGLILLAMFCLAVPVILIENGGPLESMGRSRELSRGGRGRIIGILIVSYLITFLPVIAMTVVAGVGFGVGAVSASPAILDGVALPALTQAGSSIITALTWPFFVAVTVLLYVDRRARTEAPDLEAAAARLRMGA